MKVSVLAPATVANIGPGFDILGLSLKNLGDKITISKNNKKEVIISSNKEVPLDPEKNTAGRGLLKLIKDKNLSFGFNVHIEKSIPLCSGLGGSASSAVGSILGANEFLKEKLTQNELLHYSLEGEGATGSFHLDNVAPCLFGGIVFVSNSNQVISISKKEYNILIIHQNISINTNESRKRLPKQISLLDHIKQSQNLTSLILGFSQDNNNLIKEGLNDLIIEPTRKNMISNFDLIKKELIDFTLGGSISGSGPSMFFLYEEENKEILQTIISKLNKQISLNYFFEKVNSNVPKVEKL